MIFYTNRFIPQRFDDYVIGPIAFIRPTSRSDLALLAHVETHIEQFWRNPFKVMLSPWVKEWKFELEVEAFREQLCHGADLDKCAELLATKYGFDLSIEEAASLLKEEN